MAHVYYHLLLLLNPFIQLRTDGEGGYRDTGISLGSLDLLSVDHLLALLNNPYNLFVTFVSPRGCCYFVTLPHARRSHLTRQCCFGGPWW